MYGTERIGDPRRDKMGSTVLCVSDSDRDALIIVDLLSLVESEQPLWRLDALRGQPRHCGKGDWPKDPLGNPGRPLLLLDTCGCTRFRVICRADLGHRYLLVTCDDRLESSEPRIETGHGRDRRAYTGAPGCSGRCSVVIVGLRWLTQFCDSYCLLMTAILSCRRASSIRGGQKQGRKGTVRQ